MTGLTGTSDQSDRCVLVWDLPRVNCLTRVSLGCVVLGWFGGLLLGFVKGSSSLQNVFWGCFGSRA
jgi:hypothetical protein